MHYSSGNSRIQTTVINRFKFLSNDPNPQYIVLLWIHTNQYPVTSIMLSQRITYIFNRKLIEVSLLKELG